MYSLRCLLQRRHPTGRRAFIIAIPSLVLLASAAEFSPAGERIVPVETEQSALQGQWFLDPSPDPDRVHFGFRIKNRHGNSSWGRTIPLARLEGLAPGALEGDDEDVFFRVVRDAGTFHCKGSITNGRGAGVFKLKLDPSFARDLERRGVGRLTEADQARLAFADAGFALLDALRKEQYPTPKMAMLVRMADHGVTADYVTGLAEVGYRLGSLERLVEARDHGVDASLVRDLKEEGFRELTYEQVLRVRDHGVTPDYIQGMREVGIRAESIEQLVELRDHGVDPDYVMGMRKAGYKNANLDELRMARDHGVDADYVQELAARRLASRRSRRRSGIARSSRSRRPRGRLPCERLGHRQRPGHPHQDVHPDQCGGLRHHPSRAGTQRLSARLSHAAGALSQQRQRRLPRSHWRRRRALGHARLSGEGRPARRRRPARAATSSS